MFRKFTIVISCLIFSSCSYFTYVEGTDSKKLSSLHGDYKKLNKASAISESAISNMVADLKDSGATCAKRVSNIYCFSLYGHNGKTIFRSWHFNSMENTLTKSKQEKNIVWDEKELLAAQISMAIGDNRELI